MKDGQLCPSLLGPSTTVTLDRGVYFIELPADKREHCIRSPQIRFQEHNLKAVFIKTKQNTPSGCHI